MENSSSSNSKQKLPSNFNTLTFTVACPSCGAPVEFASVASVMAVCEYCQTTVVRKGDEVVSQGKQSLTIEDYSPLQIGSFGSFQKNTFAVVGRIQYQYTEGVWNEWYIQFANGHNGWLSEALGQYTLTLNKGVNSDLPLFEELSINQTIIYDDVSYNITDKRTAKAIAGQGELPFVMGEGFQTWVADARYQRKFISLDYSNGIDSHATVFKGISVSLDDLSMQMLKTDVQVNQATAENKINELGKDTEQKIDKIDCPNCGSPVPHVPGVTNCLLCPACHSEVQLTGANAEVVKVHSMMQHWQSSLKLGAKARIKEVDLVKVGQFTSRLSDIELSDSNNGKTAFSDTASEPSNPANQSKYHDFVVIGIQRLQEVGSCSYWTEYLLYSFTGGFLWFSEEPKRGWMISRVVNEFPTQRGQALWYDNRVWNDYTGSYQSKVVFAIGAFNWQVKVNDYMDLTDYSNGKDVLTAEQNDSEITYTIANPISNNQMKTWFGSQLSELDSAKGDFGQYNPENYQRDYDYDEDDEDFNIFSAGSYVQVLIGLATTYFFLFLGSMGAFFLSLLMAIIALIVFTIITNTQHEYNSIGDIASEVYHEKRMFTRVIAWLLVIVTVVMNSVIFGFHSESSGSGYYYSSGSSGRTGYSSGGSHK